MGREIRRVPKGWEHPRDGYEGKPGGRYLPMYDETYAVAARRWMDGAIAWDRRETKESREHAEDSPYFWDWEGEPPDEASYRPEFASVPTCFQIYETVSEGTPVSPVFETEDELVAWIVREWHHSEEAARAFVKAGSVPSMFAGPGGVFSNLEMLEPGVIESASKDLPVLSVTKETAMPSTHKAAIVVVRLADEDAIAEGSLVVPHWDLDETVLSVWNRRYAGWTLPGGMVEHGETTRAAAARELYEETNLDASDDDMEFVYEAPATTVDDRARHVLAFRLAGTMGHDSPCGREDECPVAWKTWRDLLEISPFGGFYKTMLDSIERAKQEGVTGPANPGSRSSER